MLAGPGNASCVCAEGWTGDGKVCVEINNCELESQGGCSPNAKCTHIGPGQVSYYFTSSEFLSFIITSAKAGEVISAACLQKSFKTRGVNTLCHFNATLNILMIQKYSTKIHYHHVSPALISQCLNCGAEINHVECKDFITKTSPLFSSFSTVIIL